MKPTRREALAGLVQVAGARTPRFLTPAEFALLDELCELIIPADEHSPGARVAQVAAYIDGRLSEEGDAGREFREGLKRIAQHQRSELTAVLTRISRNEANPQTADETFFVELKRRTAHAYYTSKVGIHAEMGYKGNTIQQA